MSDYRTFYKTQREKGKTDAQAKAAWTKAKGKAKEAAKTERDVVTLASLDIYALADRILGHSDFLHEAGMMSADPDRKTLAVELSRSRDTKTKKGWSTWNVDDPAFVEGLRGIQKKYKPHGLKMTVAVRNPSAAYQTAVDLPGLTAQAGDKFYYPTRRPELGAPGVVAEQQLPEGMEIVPRMHQGKNGKRLMVFCLFLDGSDTGRYATSPERAAELATRLKVEDGKVSRDYSGGAKQLTARFNPFWVSPQGQAGYLSEESHAAYKQKHPTRGLVPSFMERQVRIETPEAPLPPGWDIQVVSVLVRNEPTDHYRLFYGGRDTGKYALDWNKAVEIAKRTDPKTGKRIYGSRN